VWGRAASTADPVTTLRYQDDAFLLPTLTGVGCTAAASCESAAQKARTRDDHVAVGAAAAASDPRR